MQDRGKRDLKFLAFAVFGIAVGIIAICYSVWAVHDGLILASAPALSVTGRRLMEAGVSSGLPMSHQSNIQTEEGLQTILAAFAPGMSLYVPDEVLALWYPPGPVGGEISSDLEQNISIMAAHCSCAFSYLPERQAGCFTKLARC